VSKLKVINYDVAVEVLAGIGYVVSHQRGSHIVMRLIDSQKFTSMFGCRRNQTLIVVPAHRPLGKGMLRTIVKEVDLSVEEFNKLV
jgi:predicted RNA binding protein YcfA (HicA-like mRNA interferase family)